MPSLSDSMHSLTILALFMLLLIISFCLSVSFLRNLMSSDKLSTLNTDSATVGQQQQAQQPAGPHSGAH